jgi:hydroxylamine reductase (hybrid-cluster protein)
LKYAQKYISNSSENREIRRYSTNSVETGLKQARYKTLNTNNRKENGMARDMLTDDQVSQEIERLKNSDHVKLAKKEIRLKYKQRKWLYQLRYLEKRGKQLEADGMTIENIEKQLAAIPVDED